jgi:endo-1,3(4)-beta-glucanase
MSRKILVLALFIFLLFITVACGGETTSFSSTNEAITTEIIVETPSIDQIIGLDDVNHTVSEYFSPLKGVSILNQNGEDITELLSVEGYVHYGEIGSYSLRYTLAYGESFLDETRVINIVDGTISRLNMTRDIIDESLIMLEDGSYRVGNASEISHPTSPLYINDDLLGKAIPSNGWWTQLLVQNYGGGNGIYTNPLRSAFSNQGVEITNPGSGFVQYWNPEGYNTMANFSLALPDMFVKSSSLNTDYQTFVIDYSDTTVSVAMRNNGNAEDQMVMTYAQGSPYIFAEVADSEKAYLTLASNGVIGYEYYDLAGNLINGSNYTGDGLVVRLIQKHIGYVTFRPSNVGQPIYSDRYFLVSLPSDSQVNLSSKNHPSGLINHLDINLNSANYFSIAAINSLSEAEFYHRFAFNRSLRGTVDYTVDEVESEVITNYQQTIQILSLSDETEVLQFLMPHHYQNSEVTLTDKEFNTVRGQLKLYQGNDFTTSLAFNGVVPALALPENSEFDESDMNDYLVDLDTRTSIDDEENFLNAEGPYWNGKAIYPLAQGLIIADQIDNDSLKQSFISKLRYLLEDWLTYSSTADEKYLYYNEEWGTVYYSNNDFNTATELSDHSFTHGYLIYAASVLGMYDSSFISEYGPLVEMLINDVSYTDRDNYDFGYLRAFDKWAGHTWAHGFGTFAEGNNIESSSEAISSWVGIYLWSLNTGDVDMRDAAIYGFVHELSSAKTYMFDYSEMIFPDNYSQYALVAGMIWGGKYDYATWFGANPTFIYGIQWLPNGEYLSNYAINTADKEYLAKIFAKYLNAKDGEIDTWFANMWSIQALIDSGLALQQFDAEKILNDDYPSDLAQTYYLLNAIKYYGDRTDKYSMIVNENISSSIYINSNGDVIANIWNASANEETCVFVNQLGETIEIVVPGNSLTRSKIN